MNCYPLFRLFIFPRCCCRFRASSPVTLANFPPSPVAPTLTTKGYVYASYLKEEEEEEDEEEKEKEEEEEEEEEKKKGGGERERERERETRKRGAVCARACSPSFSSCLHFSFHLSSSPSHHLLLFFFFLSCLSSLFCVIGRLCRL